MTITSILDIEKIEQIPLANRGWAHDTFTLISRAADTYGAAPALTWLPNAAALDVTQTWTYVQLRAEIIRAANLFHELGCRVDDVIAYALPNLPHAHFVLWGAEATGIAFAINPMLAPGMMLALLASMRVKVLVVDPSVLSLETRNAIEKAELACLKTVLVVGSGTMSPRIPATVQLEPALARQPADRLLSRRTFMCDDRSSAFCTGGTTGAPKVAIRTHGSEAINAHMLASVLDGVIKRGDSLFCGLPLFHVNAILVTGTMPWINGAHVLLGPRNGYRDRLLVENFWRIVERFRLTMFSGVPTLYSTLLDIPIAGADVSSLRLGICGAAPMPVELFQRFEAATGIRILEGYGLTETACAAALNPVDGRRPIGSVGLRLPYQELRIAVVENGHVHEAEGDEIGSLAISGPNVFVGYAEAAHNESAWIDFGDGRCWLDTGDLGRVDEYGYIWLMGRRKELIIRGGHNIDPKLIEEALHRHPAVALAAAIGRPDIHAGEVPVAYVELREGAEVSAEALRLFAQTEVSERAATPKEIIILDKLPTTAVGKLFKPALTLLEIERVVRSVAQETGVALRSVEMTQDPRRGPLARVIVDDNDREALAKVLGRYAFAVHIQGAPDGVI